MHVNIDYGTPSKEADLQALQDIKEWVGEEKYEKFVADLRSAKKQYTEDQFDIMLGIGGISGYPVRAFRRYVYNISI